MIKYIKYFVLIFFSCYFIYSANAGTINAASCSRSDVQTAINSAIDGDVVIIPAGNCRWTAGVSRNLESANMGIKIQGSGDQQTIIIKNLFIQNSIIDLHKIDRV